jgi:hypothetical protein
VRTRILTTAAATAALLALLAGCTGDDVESDPPEVALDDRVAVLAPDVIAGTDVGAVREPEVPEVLDAEEVLERRFERAAERHPDLEPWSGYVRQYVGLEDGGLAVNAFCQEPAGWRSVWIIVQDGGACYWQARIEDGRVTSFTVNGEA